MNRILKTLYTFLLSVLTTFCATQHLQAQSFTIKGKIIDAETGEAIPFGNVYPKSDPQKGTTTDFDGYYTLKLTQINDSIVVSYIGYKTRTKAIDPKNTDNNVIILNFQLESESTKLAEIVVESGEDPSYPVMRNVLKNKEINDKRRLDYYEYESYTKVELDIDNVTEKFGERKIIQKVQNAIEEVGGLTGEDGQPLIPLFLSETISHFYFKGNPERKKEQVIKTKIEGVGVDDNSPLSQLLGSSFQEYNFYKNWMKILEKDFVSPLSDGWKSYYDYYMADSMMIGEHFCYKIEIYPKREQDLAFEGIIWIDKATYALKQIDVKIGKIANINFVEKLKIQQELAPTANGAWLPVKTRVLIDIAQLTEKSAGIIAKFYVSNKDLVVNKEYPIKFYNQPLIVNQDAYRYDEKYWPINRHDSLTPAEIRTYELIDTIKQVPVVKTYSEILNILGTGYFTAGPIDIGNYLFTYAFNDVEGQRFRIGARTNTLFSDMLELKGYVAYGTKDKELKYGGRIRFIPSRKRWTEIGVEHRHDILQVGANSESVVTAGAFVASLSFFNVSDRSPFYMNRTNAFIQSDIAKGFTQTLRITNLQLNQIGNHFAYLEESGDNALISRRDYTTTELIFETRLSKDELYLYNGNERFSLGGSKLPTVTFRYTLGLKNFWGGDFEYHKFAVAFEQDLRLGVLGSSYYNLYASYTPSTLPYTLLDIHLGNQGFFYNFYGFNLMNYREFISDKQVTFNWEHNFNGLIANRVGFLKKLKLRTFVVANAAYGSLRQANRDIIPATDPFGFEIVQPQGFSGTPYVEVGYGLGNILRFFRVYFMHRLTYLSNPDARKFGVFFQARFEL